MTARVKLCAIARNEGPYVADWIFHHLHFGFDAIEVWINGTEDPSGRIIKHIAELHPQVTRSNVDDLMQSCLDEGSHFQLEAYRRLARRARRQGFTHVAFLDLDEYWTPRDFRSSIHSFLPDDPQTNVVSFPWCVDLPDLKREPFEPVWARSRAMQMHHHVKSVGRLDTPLKPLVHTFKTSSGDRLWVREPFPLDDVHLQRYGSMVTIDHWRMNWERLPEAFVYHAMHRSQAEYLAHIADGQRQNGRHFEFKKNRKGYLPTQSPALTFEPPRLALRSYRRRRKDFYGQLALEPLITRSRQLTLRRATGLRSRIASDPEAKDVLRQAIQGTSLADT